MEIKVFKFGGASVNSAEAVQNATSIVKMFPNVKLMIIISAMGKTTNLLEKLADAYFHASDCQTLLEENANYHLQLADKLLAASPAFDLQPMHTVLADLASKITISPSGNYDLEYDQIVSYGEILSTTIISSYWESVGLNNLLIDARQYVCTNHTYRDAVVDWETTTSQMQKLNFSHNPLMLSQGFIAGTADGYTTTLGREGSDYSAAIFAYCLQASEMTIWKDVPGLLNADPKYFTETQKLDFISYRDAIELAYYGATIIHPKTIKPLQNRNIPLRVKSFVQPAEEGSQIGNFDTKQERKIPCFIFKILQILITISPKDFSFIAEDNLCDIFSIFAENGIKINLMQNSAISFSICIDENAHNLEKIVSLLQAKFNVRYNTGLELITILHHNQETIDKMLHNKTVLLELKSRYTAQFVVRKQEL